MKTKTLKKWLKKNNIPFVEKENSIECVDHGFEVGKIADTVYVFDNEIYGVENLKIMQVLCVYALTPIEER